MSGQELSREIGRHIRCCRKKRNMTLVQLAQAISKSKATVSKYETGEISVDVATLYEIADACHVHVEQLLCTRQSRAVISSTGESPAFFSGLSQFYSYMFDGRNNQLMRCVFDVLSEEEPGRYKAMMYMNFQDFDDYQDCENTYWGYIEHYDALTNIVMTNQDTPMEQIKMSILASFLDANTKWGLFCGISSRPMMPVANKMLFARGRLPEDAELIGRLKISKEDIRLLRLYNMFSVV
ncbi:MAG: helix-turn-helix transcriptional regulator [Oscillospiraceae bacterium]|nr:helix-turn-helix transcriptional regulator [Oscillospiraceae bacterium]